jgi:release factor glutamine methyltransferase
MTVAEVAAALAAAGVPSPQHDARILVAQAADAATLQRLVARAARVPLQHLTGRTGFRYLDLAVGPGVFVPRPETELLVDAVLRSLGGASEPVVVDLCAGSGAVGLSVAHEHPSAVVHLVERADAAFDWLVRNATGRERVHLHHDDLATAPTGLDGAVDAVVSNPPYLPHADRPLVDPEVRDHDPEPALWADDDGLAVIRRVTARAARLLRAGGALVVEHSDQQGTSVPSLVAEAGFVEVADHADLTGRPRFCTASWPAQPC